MQFLFFIFSILILSACGSAYERNLDTLGTESNFSDVSIPDTFTPPEEDIPEEEDLIVEIPEVEIPPVEVTPPPVQVSLKNTFAIENRQYSLAHGPAWRWLGCDKTKMSQGGYNSDSQCGTAFLHPAFINNLQEDFYVCVTAAAREAGYPDPSRVFIRHVGSYNDRPVRNGTRLSNHAYARALDITNFNLYDSKGRLSRVSTYQRDYAGNQAVFYDEFRSCWKASLPSNCQPGQTEYKGSIGHNSSELGGNSLHNDHLHLSYPLCAGNS